ncbi:unnamed protein product [Cyprideis torosa]|uniref:Uncharacterized protein n=1 Tax=Cyprideis torosa TaxID=163714 RepID=A0A7R8WDL1_9CRUS|nr:unnamed protein product [Cyprideis torosa]CAG0888704.1 unnamed protein product [Cyprideis torosa]
MTATMESRGKKKKRREDNGFPFHKRRERTQGSIPALGTSHELFHDYMVSESQPQVQESVR